MYDYQSRRDEPEVARLPSSSDIQYGKHSQPTTPPEYSDSFGFPTALSRPNRFSMSSITGVSTPRGTGSRPVSQIMSPPSAQGVSNGHLPSQSVPGSRRNSDEEGENFDKAEYIPTSPVFRTYVLLQFLLFLLFCGPHRPCTLTPPHFTTSALHPPLYHTPHPF